jgi:uncharacterized protein YerC
MRECVPIFIDRKKLKRLLAKELTYAVIANEMGCSLTSVARIANREFGAWRHAGPHSKKEKIA